MPLCMYSTEKCEGSLFRSQEDLSLSDWELFPSRLWVIDKIVSITIEHLIPVGLHLSWNEAYGKWIMQCTANNNDKLTESGPHDLSKIIYSYKHISVYFKTLYIHCLQLRDYHRCGLLNMSSSLRMSISCHGTYWSSSLVSTLSTHRNRTVIRMLFQQNWDDPSMHQYSQGYIDIT